MDEDDDFYLEVAKQGSHLPDFNENYWYTRYAFDWDASDRAEIVKRCARMPEKWTMFADGVVGVYIVGPPDAPYAKIGITVNPIDRLCSLQNGCWDKLRMHYLLCVYDEQAKAVEQAALGLAKLRGLETRNEWVGVEASRAFELVLDAAAIEGVDAIDFPGHRRMLSEQSMSSGHSRMRLCNARDEAEKAQKWANLGY